MVEFFGLLDTMLLFHFLPFLFIIANIYTEWPVGIKAYFLGQIVATVLVIQAILASVTSITAVFAAYLAFFQEGIIVICVLLCGILFWSADEMGPIGTRWDVDPSDALPGAPASPAGGETGRGPLVQGKVVIGLFLCSLIVARVIPFVLPSLPSSGVSFSTTPQVAVYQAEVFYNDYEFVIKLLKVIRLDLYLVIAFLGVMAMLGSDLTPKNMKYSYLIFGTMAQVVVLPVALLSVFGLTFFDVTIIPPFTPARLVGNVSVLAAPVFLLVLVVGSITREFLRKAEHTYGS